MESLSSKISGKHCNLCYSFVFGWLLKFYWGYFSAFLKKFNPEFSVCSLPNSWAQWFCYLYLCIPSSSKLMCIQWKCLPLTLHSSSTYNRLLLLESIFQLKASCWPHNSSQKSPPWPRFTLCIQCTADTGFKIMYWRSKSSDWRSMRSDIHNVGCNCLCDLPLLPLVDTPFVLAFVCSAPTRCWSKLCVYS